MKPNIKIAKILSLVVAASGILVIIGWAFDISILKCILPNWVTMKFSTALSFLLSGISLYFIARAQEGEFDKAQIALSITSLIIFILMGTLFFSSILGIRTEVESLFIKEAPGAVKSVGPGMPSIATIFNFILIAIAGILTTFNPKNLSSRLSLLGWIIGVIGGLAIIGYIINVPALYYFIEGISTGMAVHTAVLFILIGIGLICL